MKSTETTSARIKIFLGITKSSWGGAQKYVFDLATHLPADQFDVSVLVGGTGPLKEHLDAAGIRTVPLLYAQRDIDAKKEFKLLWEIYALYMNEQPDIVHLNSSKMGFVGSLAAVLANISFFLRRKKHRVRSVFTAHGWAFNEERSVMSKISFRLLHMATIVFASQTIAVTTILQKQIPRPFRRKITIIHNGLRPIDFKDKNTARAYLLEQLPASVPHPTDTALWIGTVSELHSNKGLSYGIKAMAQIQEPVLFFIIGEGEERGALEALIAAHGVSGKVFLLGHIPEAATYLKAFDIFTLTSITEAFPYVLLEAGAAGLPVVASNVGGIPEIIENNVTGTLIKSRNPEEIRHAIEDMRVRPEKPRSFGHELEKRVQENFQLDQMLEKTFALYRRILTH